MVSEPIKPCMDVVVMANTVHGYMSQSDKGEMVIGGGTDGFNNYSQRGSWQHIEETVRALIETFPMLSRLKMLRQWGGIVDMTGDRSPIISKTPLGNCFINCGWGTGGFKAIPGSGWAMAVLMAKGEPGPLAEAFNMWRFKEGQFIDESFASGVALFFFFILAYILRGGGGRAPAQAPVRPTVWFQLKRPHNVNS